MKIIGITSRPTLIMLTLALLAFTPGPAHATVEFAMEDWGLGGVVKAGMWAPLYLELTSRGEDFRGYIQLEIDTGQKVKPLFVKPLELIANTRTRHWLYMRTPVLLQRGTFDYRFKWRIINSADKVVQKNEWPRESQRIIPTYDSIVALFGTANISKAGLATLHNKNNESRVYVQRIYPQSAPNMMIGYDGIDALVWANPNPALLLSEQQHDAIIDYVRSGGHLVLACSTGWQALTNSFLSELLPATPTGTRDIRQLDALASYGLREEADKAITIVRLTKARGKTLMTHQDEPVIVRGSVGSGHVTLIGFDPTKEPFCSLSGRDVFWSRLLNLSVAPDKKFKPWGLTCATGSALRSLNDFPGFKPINFTFVVLFMIAYIILIGPVDYFLLKRLKKLHWTWVTFPAVAILCSYIAFVMLSSGRVSGFMANSVSIVDASADGEEATGATFMTMLSPAHKRYNIKINNVTDYSILPREYTIDSYRRQASGLSRSECFSFGSGKVLNNLLVRIWDAQTLEAYWRAPQPDLPTVDIAKDPKGLAGSVKNTTSHEMLKVKLLYMGKVYDVGKITSGQTKNINSFSNITIEAYFKSLKGGNNNPDYYPYYFQFKRTDADNAVRWLALCSYCPAEYTGGYKGYFIDSDNTKSRPVIFDMPRRFVLRDSDSPSKALLVYSTAEPVANITFSKTQPKLWTRTIYRMRVPVK